MLVTQDLEAKTTAPPDLRPLAVVFDYYKTRLWKDQLGRERIIHARVVQR